MKKILIIRHAESVGNAGGKIDTHDAIPLSEKGRLQAQVLAETLDVIPDLIVLSSFSRTRETAEPFIAKNPSIPVEIWDVEEFTYLDPRLYNDADQKERQKIAIDYWRHADIHHKTGEGVESFSELIARMKRLVKKLEGREEKTIAIFSHGRFIYGLKTYLQKVKERGSVDLSDEDLEELKELHALTVFNPSQFPIDNTSVHTIEL
ncbi:MAG: histidine phosphatase family protein [Candidatus Paceibacterota bacterium]